MALRLLRIPLCVAAALFSFVPAAQVRADQEAHGVRADSLAGRIAMLEKHVAASSARLSSLRVAQLFDRPADDAPPPQQQAPQADDPSVRLDRLEGQLRSLTGRIEKAEFDIRKVEEKLEKFKQDVDFRFQDVGAGRKQRHSDAGEGAESAAPPTRQARRGGDAFDPDAAPGAPGAPHALGSPESAAESPPARSPSGPVVAEDDPNAPLDLSRGATGSIPRRGRRPVVADTGAGDAPAGGPAAISPSPGVGARAEFDAAVALLRQGQYKSAETNLQAFIDKHPKDRLVADAVYYLGEAYALRGRQREAAEQFLKVSTDYARSSRAPDGMVKLGVSLNALGAKEQACATFGEVPRKFPNASTSVRNRAEQESRRARC